MIGSAAACIDILCDRYIGGMINNVTAGSRKICGGRAESAAIGVRRLAT